MIGLKEPRQRPSEKAMEKWTGNPVLEQLRIMLDKQNNSFIAARHEDYKNKTQTQRVIWSVLCKLIPEVHFNVIITKTDLTPDKGVDYAH